MKCCGQCAGIEQEFDARVAARELAGYRRRGPAGSTKLLIDMLRAEGVGGSTLLDIGGGIGAIQHELFAAGVGQITSVDAASAYLAVQQSEAARRGYADRATYLGGDFVALAERVPQSDIVTLDRVLCCYHDMRSLVELSAARARRLYGVVYPRATVWNAAGVPLINAVMWLRRRTFRSFLHPPAQVDGLIRSHGLVPRLARQTILWHVAVYGR